MGSGNLSVSTRSRVAGQRWRTTIARLNTGETVGQVNVGSAATFTGAAVRSAATNASFVVIVSLEGALRDPLNASVLVRFNGPFVTVIGPRPNVGDSCRTRPGFATSAEATHAVLHRAAHADVPDPQHLRRAIHVV